MMRARRGFTLWEMTIVLALVALGTALVVPNWIDFDASPIPVPGESVVALLRDARRVAIEGKQTVAVRIDPSTRYFRVDTTGVSGTGALVEGELQVGAYEALETDLPRVQFVFLPSGAALGDSVLVRGSDGPFLLTVDPWSGQVVLNAR
jgi:prepilin-type N-terminal cleavage/methylation domain-containing protein